MKLVYTIGIDEVGRGPVAGPITVCACAIKVGASFLQLFPRGELKDSKKLSEKARLQIAEQLTPFIEDKSIVFGIGEVDASHIDSLGISQAIKKAMRQALESIHKQDVSRNSFIFLDGSLKADEAYQQETIIKGDEKIQEIALASILAKVHRDTFMKKIATEYPSYGFEKHVGYGTKAHYEAMKKYGLTPLHRRTFLKKILENA